MELVITALAVFTVTCLGGLGIVALPWSESELEASAGAFAALPEVARAVVPVLGAGAAAAGDDGVTASC